MVARLFGAPTHLHMKIAEKVGFHSCTQYMAIMDNASLWNPATLDKIVEDFPEKWIDHDVAYLLLAECLSNAAKHAEAELLVFTLRRREKSALLSFFQLPPMDDNIIEMLGRARSGFLPDYLTQACGGIGLPILTRLTHKLTISSDRTKLQLWIRV